MKTTNAFIAQQCDQAGEIVEFDCAVQPAPPAFTTVTWTADGCRTVNGVRDDAASVQLVQPKVT